jgi:type II restriction/modification system DNA methylase subunit YeeA
MKNKLELYYNGEKVSGVLINPEYDFKTRTDVFANSVQIIMDEFCREKGLNPLAVLTQKKFQELIIEAEKQK